MRVDSEMIQKARSANLYDFLLSFHSDKFVKEGNSIRMMDNHSVSIRRDFYGYHDFATGESGNGISFLMQYLGYSFPDAVTALSGVSLTAIEPDSSVSRIDTTTNNLNPNGREILLPSPAPFPHSRMFAYLIHRGIPAEMIRRLAKKHLVYQSAKNSNIVFVSSERDYCEIRGTNTFASKPFRGSLKAAPDRSWSFPGGTGKTEKAYITEAAIDAISLFLLQEKEKLDVSHSLYVSIGGVSNYQAIDRIKGKYPCVLAVDNDKAGQICRDRYPDLPFILPINKDWNDDLRSSSSTSKGENE